ncbi:MAG: chaperone modulator CbpM [Spirochaetales bacterium]
MKRQTMIALSEVCDFYHIDIEVIRDFSEFGLYPLAIVDGEAEIEAKYLDKLDAIIGLHRALGINKEGIDVILELRERVSGLQDEIESLRHEIGRLRSHIRDMEPETLERQGLLIEISD